ALRKAEGQRKVTLIRAGADRLVVEGGRVAGVAAGAEVHRAGHVIIAGGAWTPALAGPLGVSIAVAPQRGQIIHLQVADRATGDWPVVHAFHDHYIVSWAGGRVVAGGPRGARPERPPPPPPRGGLPR